MYWKSYCTTSGVGVGGYGGDVGVDKMLKVYLWDVLSFYGMGKALSDELSCARTDLVIELLSGAN